MTQDNTTLTRVPKKTLKRLKIQAAKEDRSIIELLTEIVDPALEKREREYAGNQ